MTGISNWASRREIERDIFWASEYVFADYSWLTLDDRIYYALFTIRPVYYPIVAVVAIPVNVLTIKVLSRGKCGLSSSVTSYLVAMAASDLMVVVLDLVLRQIPIVYREQFRFLFEVHVCNIHAVLLHVAIDCSVWFTVTFTLDRFVSICCQKLRTNYCTDRTVVVALGSVTVLSCSKNVFWYFIFTGEYRQLSIAWFCRARDGVLLSPVWIVIELLHYLLTPGIPFCLILLLNVLTARHVLVTSRARRRLRVSSTGYKIRDPEMESRRKSLVLLLAISGNFILLWGVYMIYNIWGRMYDVGYKSLYPPDSLNQLGFMLQLLSCCTNTALYSVTQRKFREQLKETMKFPFTVLANFLPR
ncbi:probable G-protein coupled receptor 139 [Hemitrygon akajei]|uniref:probable G-protein coupled receptor 139 n=1 Tax=Hemitrygon akajei TaxID=2704970 RepID=UPI003BF9C577